VQLITVVPDSRIARKNIALQRVEVDRWFSHSPSVVPVITRLPSDSQADRFEDIPESPGMARIALSKAR
jgi:hypothetical protein